MRFVRSSPLVVLLVAGALRAQQAGPSNGWALGIGGIVILPPAEETNLGGPALQASRVVPRGVGFDARVAYLLPSGSDDSQGLSAILGLSYGVPVHAHLLQLKGGITGFGLVSGDTGGGAAGPYFGGSVLVRLGSAVGVQVDALARSYSFTTQNAGLWPSFGFAIVALPHGP